MATNLRKTDVMHIKTWALVFSVIVGLIIGSTAIVYYFQSIPADNPISPYAGIGYSVVQTSDGGYAIAGVCFSEYSNEWSGKDFYLVKTDAEGNELWEKVIGGADSNEYAYSVVQSEDGGYVLTGFTGAFKFAQSVYAVKTDSSGNVLWNKTYGPGIGNCIIKSSDGGYLIAGNSPVDKNNRDIYLVKTDSSGNIQWNRTLSETGYNGMQSVIESSDGGYVIANYRAGDIGSSIIKTDANGNKLWNRTYNGGGPSIVATSDGGYVIAGSSLIKTDPLGNVIWERAYSGSVIQSKDGFATVSYYLTKIDSDGDIQWKNAYNRTNNAAVQTLDRGYAITGFFSPSGSGNQVSLVKTDSFGNQAWSKTYPNNR